MKKGARRKKKSVSGAGSTQLLVIDAKLDRVIDAISVLPTRKEFHELEGRVARMEKTLEGLLTAIDKLTKSVESLMLEYGVIKMQLERYDRWFKEIAKKVGIELKP